MASLLSLPSVDSSITSRGGMARGFLGPHPEGSAVGVSAGADSML